MQEKFLV
jgi:hypothetical protein